MRIEKQRRIKAISERVRSAMFPWFAVLELWSFKVLKNLVENYDSFFLHDESCQKLRGVSQVLIVRRFGVMVLQSFEKCS